MKLLVFIALCVLGVAASPIEGPQTVIVNGNDVPAGLTVPYHIHLHLVTPGPVTQVGSGVYIGTEWVITVAQNLKQNLNQLRCGFGNRDRNELTWLVAINFIPHPQYNAQTLENNIGLIQLPSVPAITAIPMAIPTTIQVAGTLGMIYGFGFTQNGGEFATILQQAAKTIETDAACATTYPHLTYLLLTNFCAIGAGTVGNVPSMCGGDQGGAFVANNVLVGISSFTRSSNCLDGQSSGFVRVSAYREWIMLVASL